MTESPTTYPTTAPTATATPAPSTLQPTLQTSGSIGGIISGTLGTVGFDNIFYVTDGLVVPAGSTLTIAKGSSLVFAPGKGMQVAGTLMADGNFVFPIRFISTEEAGWAGLRFLPSSQGSLCLGCELENLMTNTVALQVEAPVTFERGLIRDVPGGTAISSTVPFTLSNVLIDYVGTGLYLGGSSGTPYTASQLTLSRCQRGVVNHGQALTLANSILVFCNTAVSSEYTGTTTIHYTLFDGNGQDLVAETGATIVQGDGLLYADPKFVDFPNDFRLQADSLAVDAADPQAPYNQEIGYNGGRADMGAYGNTMQATSRPPIDQMGITLTGSKTSQISQAGKTVSYTLTLKNSGLVPETYGVNIEGSEFHFRASFYEEGYQGPHYMELSPRAEISVTVWVRISPDVYSISDTKTLVVRAFNSYISDQLELTVRVLAFQETDGRIVLEAENFSYQSIFGDHVWQTQTDLDNYVGAGYSSALPDTGSLFQTPNTAFMTKAPYTHTLSPELEYTLNLTATGTYYLWLRGYAPDTAGDSVYVRLDDEPMMVVAGFAPQAWQWTDRNDEGGSATIEVKQPGLHTLHLWQREDGLRLDRIVLTTDTNYNPIGDGPPESEFR